MVLKEERMFDTIIIWHTNKAEARWKIINILKKFEMFVDRFSTLSEKSIESSENKKKPNN